MSEREVRDLADSLSVRVTDGESLLESLRDVCVRHADWLRELGPVRSLALDPCPRCWGHVFASEVLAVCRDCGWRYYPAAESEPIASRRVDQ